MGAARDSLSLRDYGAAPGSHSHDHFQVLVGIEGVLDLEIDGRARRVEPGDGAVVAPGQRHDFEADGSSRCLVLDTGHALWERCLGAPSQPQQVQALAGYLAQALLHGQPLAALHGPALLLEAWGPSTLRHQRPRRAIDWQMLSTWIQARLHEPLTVMQLADKVFLSPSQFALRCHEAHGMAPLEWLRRERLVQARRLRDSGLPVAEVARRTGYRSPSALTAALRRAGLQR
jgi:AraC-like DNA-binding protein